MTSRKTPAGSPAAAAPSAFEALHLDRLDDDGRRYLELLRRPTLSTGLYRLAAGGVDPQGPHEEDEVYYVIEGRSRFTAGGETVEATAGSVLYVAAGVEHRFHDITEDLVILVFFSAAARR